MAGIDGRTGGGVMSFNLYPGQRIDLPNGVKMLQVDPAIDTDETVLSMRLTDPFCFPLASKDDIKKGDSFDLEGRHWTIYAISPDGLEFAARES